MPQSEGEVFMALEPPRGRVRCLDILSGWFPEFGLPPDCTTSGEAYALSDAYAPLQACKIVPLYHDLFKQSFD